jgi:PAS domain S-box-containing protein
MKGNSFMTMNIAVVGGGKRCLRLMNVIQRHTFEEVDPKIVAVADLDHNSPGFEKAKSEGLFVTNDYNDFFKRDDIDLIIELTGDMDIYNDILTKKKKNVRAIANPTAQLFWEIYRVSMLQKKTDQELQETQARYRVIMNELIQEDVLVIAQDYRIMDVNDSLLNKLGLSYKEIIGKYCYDITHRQSLPCSGEKHPCPLLETINTRKPTQTTHVHLDKDNNDIFYSISTYPLLENGDVIGAIEISRDITEDINIQKAMMQQEKLASIGRLSAGVAHEINNPLTTILTTAMLMQEELDPADPNFQDLETITAETLRCRKIVASLLDFARQSKPTKKRNEINEIIKDSVILTQKQAAFKDVALICDLAEDIPTVSLDKGQVQQSIINLILNAIEATESGESINIASRFIPGKGMLEVIIRDTGSGIDGADLPKIFDPFFTTKEGGTGLGLAITHGIIEQHNGSIKVESRLKQGTTFRIHLPIESGEDDAV